MTAKNYELLEDGEIEKVDSVIDSLDDLLEDDRYESLKEFDENIIELSMKLKEAMQNIKNAYVDKKYGV